VKTKRLRLSRETLANIQSERLGAAVGGTEESREKAFCSGDSGCNWTCGAYSECFFTHCFCYSGYATDCGC
jgi:hypothetical protein